MRQPTMSGSRIFPFLLFGLALAAHAQPRFLPQPEYGQLGAPDQAEGRRVLEDFRAKGIAGDYFLEFELHVLPRRGDERVLAGQFWGTRNGQGPLSRVAIVTDAAKKTELHLLVQNGPSPAVWSWDGSDAAKPLDVAALFAPVAGTNLTAFDLQMPFLYWPDFDYQGLARLRGRPTHQFLLHPPKDFAEKYPSLAGVRVYLDTQFNALVQVELVGHDGQTLKTISLLELKRIGEQWIPKSFDVRDEVTRDKTRFLVKGAALGLKLPPEVFMPAQLAGTVNPPDAQSIVPVE
ncbi:MAG TPA: outer membrane lipoprotein-sorting protein [Opitutaceae bacterium]|nr:outer membrane lipoprotein-sorting protein [Opitutaceae bacterium]